MTAIVISDVDDVVDYNYERECVNGDGDNANAQGAIDMPDEPIIEITQTDAHQDIDPLSIVKMEHADILNKEVERSQLDQLNNFHVVKIGDDLEMFYEHQDSFTPKLNVIQMKQNDKLSGNMPFFIDVSLNQIYSQTQYE